MAELRTPQGHALLLPEGCVTVGSDPENDVPIAAHLGLAPHHFSLQPWQGGHFLEDAASGLGTLVNGHPVSWKPLLNGDLITAGDLQLVYSQTLATAHKTTPTALAPSAATAPPPQTGTLPASHLPPLASPVAVAPPAVHPTPDSLPPPLPQTFGHAAATIPPAPSLAFQQAPVPIPPNPAPPPLPSIPAAESHVLLPPSSPSSPSTYPSSFSLSALQPGSIPVVPSVSAIPAVPDAPLQPPPWLPEDLLPEAYRHPISRPPLHPSRSDTSPLPAGPYPPSSAKPATPFRPHRPHPPSPRRKRKRILTLVATLAIFGWIGHEAWQKGHLRQLSHWLPGSGSPPTSKAPAPLPGSPKPL